MDAPDSVGDDLGVGGQVAEEGFLKGLVRLAMDRKARGVRTRHPIEMNAEVNLEFLGSGRELLEDSRLDQYHLVRRDLDLPVIQAHPDTATHDVKDFVVIE